MSMALRRLYSSIRHGKPIIIVSGLPRSGTSMMMKMLEAGGVGVLTDGLRHADEDNPKGYFELERVKDLDKNGDKSWLGDARGKAIKIISFLLKDLPPDHNYRVVFMRRAIDEVLASQNKMLIRRGEPVDPASDEKMGRNYELHLRKVEYLLRNASNFQHLYIDYQAALRDPAEQARRVASFLGLPLNVEKMTEVADPKLYRNRKPSP